MKSKNLDDYIYFSLIIACTLLFILAIIYKCFFSEFKIGYCAIYDKLGIYCPGCGCTRAFEALLKFDIKSSIIYNPTVFYSAIILISFLTTQTIERIVKSTQHIMPYSNFYLYVGIFIMLSNCIIRNIIKIPI